MLDIFIRYRLELFAVVFRVQRLVRNRFLPDDIAVQWCVPVADDFHARNLARGARLRAWEIFGNTRTTILAAKIIAVQTLRGLDTVRDAVIISVVTGQPAKVETGVFR